MKVLAIDSSGLSASAAVADENSILAEFTINNGLTHSQTLLPIIDMAVNMSGTRLEEIDAIAVAAGPGSFTGLRIGSATAKGLGFALDRPIVPVSTLEGLAYRMAGCGRVICPLMDARRSQVYAGAYRIGFDGHGDASVPEEVISQRAAPIDDILSELLMLGEKVVFLGDGADAQRRVIEDKCGRLAAFAPEHVSKQSAASVAALGIKYYKMGRCEDADVYRPIYLRKPQAERERDERAKSASRRFLGD